MTQEKPNYKAMLSLMRTIHLALTVPLILFSAFIIYTNLTDPIGEVNNKTIYLLYAPGILLIIAFPMSSFLFKKFIRDGNVSAKDLRQKIGIFQTANLIRMVTFEAAGLLSVVGALQTGNSYLLVIVAIVLFMFYLLLPTPSKMSMDLEFTAEERSSLEESWHNA